MVKNPPRIILRCPSGLPVVCCILLGVMGGCAKEIKYNLTDRSCVSGNLACRFGEPVGNATCPRQVIYPNGISLANPISEEEAVILALWNNALFLETLADLGMAQGDLVQAGLLPNPEMLYYFPVSDKPFKYLFDFPLESLWLRPLRVAAAEREQARVCLRLTQSGIDLIRDTRQGYADVLLAHQRRQVTETALSIRTQIAKIAKARLDAGDISPQETSTALIDSTRADQELIRQRFEIGVAEERLRNLMGLPLDRTPLQLVARASRYPQNLDLDLLVADATNNRPDALAATQFSAAAAERLRLQKIGWVRFLGVLDATSGVNGHELGPAFRFTLPIFNHNQGNIARAEAELEKAERQRQTVHNQIVLDVNQAFLRFNQNQAEQTVLTERVLPQVEQAIRQTENAYREGNTNYIIVLQTTQQLLDSRFREVQLRADLQRAWAELERSVGRHLHDVMPLPELIPSPVTPPSTTQDAPVGKQQAQS